MTTQEENTSKKFEEEINPDLILFGKYEEARGQNPLEVYLTRDENRDMTRRRITKAHNASLERIKEKIEQLDVDIIHESLAKDDLFCSGYNTCLEDMVRIIDAEIEGGNPKET